MQTFQNYMESKNILYCSYLAHNNNNKRKKKKNSIIREYYFSAAVSLAEKEGETLHGCAICICIAAYTNSMQTMCRKSNCLSTTFHSWFRGWLPMYVENRGKEAEYGILFLYIPSVVSVSTSVVSDAFVISELPLSLS